VRGHEHCLPNVTWDELRGEMRPLVESAHFSPAYELKWVLAVTAWLRQV
jgi:hypothetical protein